MKRTFVVAPAFSFFLFIFLSCGNSMEDMVEQYNGAYTGVSLTLSDDADMLRDEYFVWEDASLILAAPPKNVVRYSWTMYDPDDGYSEVAVMTANGKNTGREFVVYIPHSGLEVNHVYKLVLQIRDTGGADYKDSCSVVVYKHYIF